MDHYSGKHTTPYEKKWQFSTQKDIREKGSTPVPTHSTPPSHLTAQSIKKKSPRISVEEHGNGKNANVEKQEEGKRNLKARELKLEKMKLKDDNLNMEK